MFGLKRIEFTVDRLDYQMKDLLILHKDIGEEVAKLRMSIEELRQMNEEAIVNRETISKFISDINEIVKISAITEERKKQEAKPEKKKKKHA